MTTPRSPSLPAWWQDRAPRERGMLALMMLALALFIGWYAVLAPLQRLADRARDRRGNAAALLAEVRAAVTETGSGGQAGIPADPLATLLQGAAAGGVSISRQRDGDGGNVVLGIDAVQAPALFAWLDTMRREHGIAPLGLEVEERNGQLQAEVTFAPFATLLQRSKR